MSANASIRLKAMVGLNSSIVCADRRQVVVHADHAHLVAEHLAACGRRRIPCATRRSAPSVLSTFSSGGSRSLCTSARTRCGFIARSGGGRCAGSSSTCTVSSTVNSWRACSSGIARRSFSSRQRDDHVFEHLVDRVLVDAGPVGDDRRTWRRMRGRGTAPRSCCRHAPAHRRTAAAGRGRRTSGDRRRRWRRFFL